MDAPGNVSQRPPRAGIFLVLLLLVSAGCLHHATRPPSGGASPSVAASTTTSSAIDPATANQTWPHVAGSISTRIIKVNAAGSGYADSTNGGNCVLYTRDNIWAISNGTFDVSWNASNPNQQRLRAVVETSSAESWNITGESPLHLEFHDLHVIRAFVMFVTTDLPVGTILDQPVKLDWTLTYQGLVDPPRNPNADCS
jgi:hypothetical protein